MKQRKIYVILILIICTSVILICGKSSDNVTLDEVKLKDNEKGNSMFAIMVEQGEGNGNYREYKDNNKWPGTGYYFNSSASGCVDDDGNEVEDAELDFDDTTKKASVKTNKTVYCYLYFSKDSELPDVTNFWIGTHHGSEYTNVNTNKKVHIEWNDEDVKDYCLTTTNSTNNCEWKSISEISKIAARYIAETTVDLEEENKKYNYYVYLKDKAGNISTLDDLNQDEITLDTEAPKITAITLDGEAQETSIKVNVTANDPAGTDGTAGSGIEHIYYQISQKNGNVIEAYQDGGKTTTHIFNNSLKAGTEYTVSVYAVDLAGNSSQFEPLNQNFTTKKKPAADILQGKVNSGGLKATPGKGDLDYRYVGKQADTVNNYVCFGATDCANSETNDHMYRIIGITSGGQLKIQKNKSLKSAMWHNDSNNNTSWSASEIYTKILKQDFYEVTSNVTTEMKSKIYTNHQWNTGDAKSFNDGTTVYNAEKLSTNTGEIGLAYASDYYFAYDETGNTNCNSSSPDWCKSWMIPTDTENLWSNITVEWTMTRYGSNGYGYGSWEVGSSGLVSYGYWFNTRAIRPVFYLQSTATISGGEGTIDNPYIIN